jgi:hypothetical protein
MSNAPIHEQKANEQVKNRNKEKTGKNCEQKENA